MPFTLELIARDRYGNRCTNSQCAELLAEGAPAAELRDEPLHRARLDDSAACKVKRRTAR